LLCRHWVLLFLLAPIYAYAVEDQTEPEVANVSTTARQNAILVFGGRMSTTDFATTMLYNTRFDPQTESPGYAPSYDNDIFGVEYEHELRQFPHDLHLRAETGIADRFGHYLVCCQSLPYPDQTVQTQNRIHTIEIWAGGKLRWDNIHVGSSFLLEFAGTVGLSAVSRAIGRERQRQIDDNGNAHLLYYLAPEMGISMSAHPNFELVLRVPHRSGGGRTLGNMEEGYNANVVGVRYSY